MFPTKDPMTTQGVARLLQFAEKRTFMEEVEDVAKQLIESKLMRQIKSIVVDKTFPDRYELRENVSRDFKLDNEGEFVDSYLFALHSKQNKTTNNTVESWNQKLFGALLNRDLSWGKYSFDFIRKYYCCCNGTYTFYSSRPFRCNHNRDIDSQHFVGLAPSFDNFAMIFSNKDNFKDVTEKCEKGRSSFQKEKISENDTIFDISDALISKVLRHSGYYFLADICVTLICWTDCFVVDGTSVCAFLATICELDPERRTKEHNIIPLAVFTCNLPLHHSIFQPVVDLLNSFFNDKNTIILNHYPTENSSVVCTQSRVTFKALPVGISKDKAMNEDVLHMKQSGYGSCANCLRIGEYCGGSVHFPFTNLRIPLRTEQFAEECEKVRRFKGLPDYGGHKGLCLWSNLNQLDPFSQLNVDDSMHDFDGAISTMWSLIPAETLLQLKQLDKNIKLTKESMAHAVGFDHKEKGHFKMIDNIMMMTYLGPALYSIGFDHDFIFCLSIMADLYQSCNSKTTPLSFFQLHEKLNKIDLLIIKLGEKVTHKFHAFTHYPRNILHRGLFWNFSAFIFESFFNNLKRVARDCKISPFPAMENYLSSLNSINLFNSLSKDDLLLFGINERKAELISDCSKKKERRSAYSNVTLTSQNQDTMETSKQSFKSFSRTVIENQQITSENYSSKVKTANHYFILQHQGKLCFFIFFLF